MVNPALEERPEVSNYKRYRCVVPSWDNSARKEQNYRIIKGFTPKLYGHWLKETVNNFTPYCKEENLLFINGWNEWAEGNHLEPWAK